MIFLKLFTDRWSGNYNYQAGAEHAPLGASGEWASSAQQPTQPTKKSYSALENAWVGPGTHHNHQTSSRQNSFTKNYLYRKKPPVYTGKLQQQLNIWSSGP